MINADALRLVARVLGLAQNSMMAPWIFLLIFKRMTGKKLPPAFYMIQRILGPLIIVVTFLYAWSAKTTNLRVFEIINGCITYWIWYTLRDKNEPPKRKRKSRSRVVVRGMKLVTIPS